MNALGERLPRKKNQSLRATIKDEAVGSNLGSGKAEGRRFCRGGDVLKRTEMDKNLETESVAKA